MRTHSNIYKTHLFANCEIRRNKLSDTRTYQLWTRIFSAGGLVQGRFNTEKLKRTQNTLRR